MCVERCNVIKVRRVMFTNVPYTDGKLVSYIRQSATILDTEYVEEELYLVLSVVI